MSEQGLWFKVELKTPGKLQIYAMAAALKKDVDLVLGKLIRWWCWLDMNCADGHSRMLPESVDTLVACKGFTKAMIAVGWAELAEDGTVDVVRFNEHNGQTAKKRALTADRVAKHRDSKKCNASGVTGALPKALQVRGLEKEKEYNKGVGIAPLHCETRQNAVSTVQPAPPRKSKKEWPEGFSAWLAPLCAAHPSLRQSQALADDVEQAALDAYARCPKAAEYAEMLKAYFDSRIEKSCNGKDFYKPRGQRKFFENLEDVVFSHAVKWDKETEWSKTQKRKAMRVAQPPCLIEPAPPQNAMSEDEKRAAIAEMRAIAEGRG